MWAKLIGHQPRLPAILAQLGEIEVETHLAAKSSQLVGGGGESVEATADRFRYSLAGRELRSVQRIDWHAHRDLLRLGHCRMIRPTINPVPNR